MGNQQILESVVQDQLRTEMPRMDIGDTVNVHYRIIEGDKERIQIFQGVLISRKGRGVNESMTVRRIVDGSGVERVFPVHTPRISMFEVVRKADARRAKLYFLRDRVGRSRRLRDRRRGWKNIPETERGQK
jgi:large subunit ribosomal protein L19